MIPSQTASFPRLTNVLVRPREEREKWCENLGFTYHTDHDDRPYWFDDALVLFSRNQIDCLEQTVNELHRLCLDLVDKVISDTETLVRIGVPMFAIPLVRQSWKQRETEKSLYGRFDLMFNGESNPILLEYNADTPTTLVESAVIQREWLKHVFETEEKFKELPRNAVEPSKKNRSINSLVPQCNVLEERLISRWKELGLSTRDAIYFTCMRDTEEDYQTIKFLEICAQKAGFLTRVIFVDEIGYHEESGFFVDSRGYIIRVLWKLYPWEFLFYDSFGPLMVEAALNGRIRVMEPPWKAVLSTKGILPLLYELNPSHPNLCPAAWEPNHPSLSKCTRVISKPIHGREGENMSILASSTGEKSGGGSGGGSGGNGVNEGERSHDRENSPSEDGEAGERVTIYRHSGSYDESMSVFQEALPPVTFQNKRYIVVGGWTVGDECAGISVREDSTPITTNNSFYIPHGILDPEDSEMILSVFEEKIAREVPPPTKEEEEGEGEGEGEEENQGDLSQEEKLVSGETPVTQITNEPSEK